MGIVTEVTAIPTELGFEMYAEKEVVLPRFTGYISRGLILALIRRTNPKEAQELHEPQVQKPYSVTPLRFKSRARTVEGYVLDPAYPCRVKFRFLEDEQVRRLIEYFAEREGVTIFDTSFKVASLQLRSATYRELEGAEPVHKFRLFFRSPTYLSSMGSKYDLLFPDPVQVFSSLMRLWDVYSDSRKFGKGDLQDYKGWLERHVGVSEYHLATVLAVMGRKKAVGFRGWATYEMDAMDEWNRVTVALAQFAEYSNIGGNRTGGFGETKLDLTS